MLFPRLKKVVCPPSPTDSVTLSSRSLSSRSLTSRSLSICSKSSSSILSILSRDDSTRKLKRRQDDRTVHFAEAASPPQKPPHRDAAETETDEDNGSLWFTEDEYQRIQERDDMLSRLITSGHFRETESHTAAGLNDFNFAHSSTITAQLVKVYHRTLAITVRNTILTDQVRHKFNRAFARCCRDHSRSARDDAFRRAARDAAYVAGLRRPTRQTVTESTTSVSRDNHDQQQENVNVVANEMGPTNKVLAV